MRGVSCELAAGSHADVDDETCAYIADRVLHVHPGAKCANNRHSADGARRLVRTRGRPWTAQLRVIAAAASLRPPRCGRAAAVRVLLASSCCRPRPRRNFMRSHGAIVMLAAMFLSFSAYPDSDTYPRRRSQRVTCAPSTPLPQNPHRGGRRESLTAACGSVPALHHSPCPATPRRPQEAPWGTQVHRRFPPRARDHHGAAERLCHSR